MSPGVWLPRNVWMFPVVVKPTAITGGCIPLPANETLFAANDAGSISYPFNAASPDWVGFVSAVSGHWRAHFNLTPLNPSNPVNGPMTWDASTKSWKCTLSTNGGPGFACTLTFEVEFIPVLAAGEQPVRRPMDELTPDLSHCWSWDEQDEQLPLHSHRVVHNGGRFWVTDHVRGLARKFGSGGVPWETDVYVWWRQ